LQGSPRISSSISIGRSSAPGAKYEAFREFALIRRRRHRRSTLPKIFNDERVVRGGRGSEE
jgi:hypothetical protein